MPSGGSTREHQALGSDLVAVLVVDLVAVTVPFADSGGAVGLGNDRAFVQLGFVEAQAHGAAEVSLAFHDVQLFFHGGNNRVLRVGLELAGGSTFKANHVAGVLDHHALQAQAQAQDRELGFAGELQSAKLAFEATDTEAAGNAYGVHTGQGLGGTCQGFALVRGGDPADLDLGFVGKTSGAESSVTER